MSTLNPDTTRAYDETDAAPPDRIEHVADLLELYDTLEDELLPVVENKSAVAWPARKRPKGIAAATEEERRPTRLRRPEEPTEEGWLFQAREQAKQSRKRKISYRATQKRLDQVRNYFDAGREGLNWYDQTREIITELFEGDQERADMFIGLLAATSPLRNIRENVNLALRAMRQWEYHLPIRAMKSHLGNILKAMKGEELSGPKVRAFEQALKGDPDAVTVDRWMMRAFGFPYDAPNKTEYRLVEKIVRRLAEEAGVQPRQYQAAVWTGIKKLEGEEADTTDPFETVLRAILQSGQMEFDFEGAHEALKAEASPRDEMVDFEAFEEALGPREAYGPEEIDEPGALVANPEF